MKRLLLISGGLIICAVVFLIGRMGLDGGTLIRVGAVVVVQIVAILILQRTDFLKPKHIDGTFPAVLDEVIHIRILLVIFCLFGIAFVTAAVLMLNKVLPAAYTYELVFGPVILVGIFWFVALSVKAYDESGRKGVKRFLLAFFFMLALANAVDLTLIKLGAWDFSDKTNLFNLHFPAPLDKTVFGKPMTVPLVELIGFNGTITWFIFFCGVFLNRLVNTITNPAEKRK